VIGDYADTSFLAALYVRDTHSEVAAAEQRRRRAPLPMSSLHGLELRNAIRLCVFRRQMKPTQARRALAFVDGDLTTGVLAATEPSMAAVWRRASDLSTQHTAHTGCRSLDILHVAAALELGATRFLTFDERQRGLARRAGLRVGPAKRAVGASVRRQR
jgi:uncharacterized protein